MARVESFEAIAKERPRVHGVVRCGYFDFIGDDGRRYMTFETYGSPERSMPDKISQSLQVDEATAKLLIKIIRGAFPHLR